MPVDEGVGEMCSGVKAGLLMPSDAPVSCIRGSPCSVFSTTLSASGDTGAGPILLLAMSKKYTRKNNIGCNEIIIYSSFLPLH